MRNLPDISSSRPSCISRPWIWFRLLTIRTLSFCKGTGRPANRVDTDPTDLLPSGSLPPTEKRAEEVKSETPFAIRTTRCGSMLEFKHCHGIISVITYYYATCAVWL